MLDILEDITQSISNARWHSFDEVASRVCKKTDRTSAIKILRTLVSRPWVIFSNKAYTKKKLRAEIPKIVDDIINGEKHVNPTSIRMGTAKARAYRKEHGLPNYPKNKTCPRVFAGIFEDEVFANHPVHECSVTSFQLSKKENTIEEIRQLAYESGGLLIISFNEDIARIHALWNSTMYKALENHPNLSPIQPNISRRREIVELPQPFLTALVAFYVRYLYPSMSKYLYTMEQYTGKEDGAIQSKFMEWILSTIRHYDHDSGVPFGAYLLNLCKRWVKELNKEVYGVKSASIQNKITRAQKNLEYLLIEETAENMALELGVSQEKYLEMKREVIDCYNVRHPHISLDMSPGVDDNDKTLEAVIPTRETTPEEYLFAENLTRVIAKTCPNDRVLKDLIRVFFKNEQSKLNKETVEYIRKNKKTLQELMDTIYLEEP